LRCSLREEKLKALYEPGRLAPTGLLLGDTKYMVIQGEPGAVIRGKKIILFYPSKPYSTYVTQIRH